MQKPGFWRRLTGALFRPRQLMVVDGRSGRPARNMLIRPIVLTGIPLLLLVVAFILGMVYSPEHNNRSLIPQNLQLQRDYDKARQRIAEVEASNDLKAAEIQSLQQTIGQQQARLEELKNRLGTYDSILEARKNSGVQILKASARRIGHSRLEYNLVLIKGGNYPLRVSGHIRILAIDDKHTETALQFANSRDRLPYRMETHTFLHGMANWKADLQPQKFVAVLYNRRGKEIARVPCELQGGKQ